MLHSKKNTFTKLAIKGHATRGKEVIEILKMLGGNNKFNFKGYDNTWYVLDDGEIAYTNFLFDELGFTLETFLENFPYKIGDDVYYSDSGDWYIVDMRWMPLSNTVVYEIENKLNNEYKTVEAKDITKNKENLDMIQFIQQDKITTVVFNKENYENEVELQLGDYEIEVRDDKTFAVLKSTYPKTIADCMNVLNLQYSHVESEVLGYNSELLSKFQELLICRNAYWQIAGEEMGLAISWMPVYKSLEDNEYFTIHTFNGKIVCSGTSHKNIILAFPTEKMRDEFYINFKDLIEKCKELL